jgi:hypothetical protein
MAAVIAFPVHVTKVHKKVFDIVLFDKIIMVNLLLTD